MVNSKYTKIQNRREINLLSPKARTITDVEAGSKVLYTWMPESSSPYIVKNLLIDFDNGCGNDDEEKKERIFRQNLPSGWGLVWVGICIIFEIRAKIRVQTFRAAMSFNKRSLIQPGHCIQHWGHHWRKRWRGREDEGTSFLRAIQRVLSNEQPLSVGKSTAHNWHNNYVSAQVTSEYMSKKTATEIVTAISRTTTKSANSSCAAHCNTTV